MENIFWHTLHNYPINKQALKEIIDYKEDDEYWGKNIWDNLPINTCTDVTQWGQNQKYIMGKRFGDLEVVGKIKRPSKTMAFNIFIIKKYGNHSNLWEVCKEQLNEEWKQFKKNYGANRKPTYVFKCVCGRYTKHKIQVISKSPRELQICRHCRFMKTSRNNFVLEKINE